MDTLLTWVFIGFLFWIFYLGGLRHIFGAGKAAIDTAQGKGDFKENLKVHLQGMGPLEVRGTEKTVGESNRTMRIIELEVRGLIPVPQKTNCMFVTSILDGTDKDWNSVVCPISDFQEPETICYQHKVDLGAVPSNVGFPRWVRAGVIIKDILQPPRRGKRNLKAILRLVNADKSVSIRNGFGSKEDPGVIWSTVHPFDFEYSDRGWLDEQEGALEVAKAILQLAVLVATKDGLLEEEGGHVLKEWMTKRLSAFSDSTRQRWKTELNAAFKQAFERTQTGVLAVSTLTPIMKDRGEKRDRLACMDLLYDVIGARGKIDAAKLALVRKVGDALGVDPQDIQRIADEKLVSATADVSSEAELEDLLDIDRSWDRDKIRKHLREEFQKWNNRLTALTDEAQRANAQRMLELIAQARKKYS